MRKEKKGKQKTSSAARNSGGKKRRKSRRSKVSNQDKKLPSNKGGNRNDRSRGRGRGVNRGSRPKEDLKRVTWGGIGQPKSPFVKGWKASSGEREVKTKEM